MMINEYFKAESGISTARQVGELTRTEYFVLSPEDNEVKSVLKTTGNWIYSNRWGMTFGIFFGAIFMAILERFSIFITKFKKNNLKNSFFGAVFGTPLGVCANCVAPIGASMKEKGLGDNFILSAMISSPTLNPVIILVIFTIFSFEMAVLRTLAIILIIFILIPFILNFFQGENNNKNIKYTFNISDESWMKAIKESIKLFLKKLKYLTFLMLPLMLLAGFVGGLITTLFPLREITFLNPDNLWSFFLILNFVIILGILMPVVTLADAIIVLSLLQIGLNPALGLALLITLPSLSIFSFLVMKKFFSLKLIFYLFLGVYIIAFIFSFLYFLYI